MRNHRKAAADRFLARLLLASIALSSTSLAQIQFTDVTVGSGMEYTGESYGASWGDYNADGWPDLFVSHHRAPPSIYLNMGNGTFLDRAHEVDVFAQFPNADQHGGSWADFDNDGDSDLFVSVGARDDSQFLVNNGAVLQNMTSNYTFDVRSWEGRMPIWMDFSGDGLLDFAISLQGQTSHLFERIGDDFIRVNSQYGNQCADNDFALLADVTRDQQLDYICVSQSPFPLRMYDITSQPFGNVTSLMPQDVNSIDAAFADFDGDLVSDAFVVRGKPRPSGVEQVDANNIEAHLINFNGAEASTTFQTAGDVFIEFHWNARSVNNILIGASGVHPPFPGAGVPITVTLSPNDPNVVGILPTDSNLGNDSIYIGYEPSTQTWQFVNKADDWSYVYAFISSTETISNLTTTGLQAIDSPQAPRLFTSGTGAYVNTTAAAGLNTPLPCVSAVAADFDNDMDLDIYVICRNAVSNAANRLYENVGGGNFVLVPGAGGAAGPVGFGVGLAESVVTADYNGDGFVDLFVTNGLALFPEVQFSNGGPDLLFRNNGNSNRWVQFDTRGTISNRDGIGAVVTVSAGGTDQRREQNGGYHRWSQNHSRLHFGLGPNDVFDMEVRWPSGTIGTYTNVAANGIYRIVEGAPNLEIVDLPEPGSQDPLCGLPAFNAVTEQAVFIAKNCTSGAWELRVSPGSPWITFNGELVSSQAFSNVTGFSLEPSDTLDITDPNRIAYTLNVGGSGVDGFSFIVSDSAAVCVDVATPAGAAVLVGADRVAATTPFDLHTLGPCSNVEPTLSVDDISVSEGAGVATFTVALSAQSASTVTVNYATADGSATSPDDFLPVSGTLTFAPGETVKTVNVTIIDDLLVEGDHSFTLNLSNPTNALLGKASGTATIIDNETPVCGLPSFNAATEQAVFIARNCTTNAWELRVSPGSPWITFTGELVASQPFTSVTGFSLEPNDILNTTDPGRIAYTLNVGGTGVDGFDFVIPDAAAVCVGVNTPAGVSVLVGPGRVAVTAPFDLHTLGPCLNVAPGLSVDDVTVGEGDGVATFTVMLSAQSAETVTVDYATADGSATAPADYLSESGTLIFLSGETVKTVQVAIIDDVEQEGDHSFVLNLSNPANAVLTRGSATATIIDNDISACGFPTFSPAAEQGIFIGKNCATNEWQLRAAGGTGPVSFRGNVAAGAPLLGVVPFSIEASDTLDFTSNTSVIDFILNVGPGGQDGFQFQVASDAGTCFNLQAPSGATILIGSGRVPVSAPFDLATLGACN